ncbi:MAG: hypothetical protein CL608_22025 [Anaerolineaceae bacterium]|nr:hypothetical protein [Anaerolineaceae bacterium]
MAGLATQPATTDPVIAWLMAGDAAIRWQTMRDLLDMPEQAWQSERQQTVTTGWGARLLAEQEENGRWGGGFYSPKWISSTYTLLTLIDIGIPATHEAARRGAELTVQEMLGASCDEPFQQKLAALDRCIVGMMLRIGVYFGMDAARIEAIVANLLAERMPDHAWNCRRHRRPEPHHSSFHTTFNVLEGLQQYLAAGNGKQQEAVLAAEQAALEFMLQHKLFRSDKTNEVINYKFTQFSYPPRWYYDILRGLSYFAKRTMPRDSRLQDAIDLLYKRRRKDGFWPVQNRHPGREFFQMEKTGGPSRWNTLRALRVLRWWENFA